MPFILPCICGSIKSELMQAFTCLTAVAAPIDLANIDTDRIIPARFLRKPKGAPGYASFLFRDVRFDADGSEKPEFVLNEMPYRGAKTSSVIAPSLGDIFHQNCYKNGLLPVLLPADIVAVLMKDVAQARRDHRRGLRPAVGHLVQDEL